MKKSTEHVLYALGEVVTIVSEGDPNRYFKYRPGVVVKRTEREVLVTTLRLDLADNAVDASGIPVFVTSFNAASKPLRFRHGNRGFTRGRYLKLMRGRNENEALVHLHGAGSAVASWTTPLVVPASVIAEALASQPASASRS